MRLPAPPIPKRLNPARKRPGQGNGRVPAGSASTPTQRRTRIPSARAAAIEQRGLADARLAADDEDRAALVACALAQRIETALLSVTPDEHSCCPYLAVEVPWGRD